MPSTKSSISDDQPCAKILYAKIIIEYLKTKNVDLMPQPKDIYDTSDEEAWGKTLNINTQNARVRMRTYIKKVKNKTLSGGVSACYNCKYS